jgi:hypothetical protein
VQPRVEAEQLVAALGEQVLPEACPPVHLEHQPAEVAQPVSRAALDDSALAAESTPAAAERGAARDGAGRAVGTGPSSAAESTHWPAADSAVRRLDDIRPGLVDIEVDRETWPVYAWLVDGRVLVDTGMTESTPELDAEWPNRCCPGPTSPAVEVVINTHLHFDHCGGEPPLRRAADLCPAGRARAVSEPDYLVEWARFDGADYRELDGDPARSTGSRVCSTPGHSPGHQCVLSRPRGAGRPRRRRHALHGRARRGGEPNLDRIHASPGAST